MQVVIPDTSTWTLADFTLQQTLGTGTFGRVRLCQHKTSKRFYAIKCLKKEAIIRMKQVEHILDEAAILMSIQHPFIVNMLKAFQDKRRVYVVLEYVVGGEVFSPLRKAGKFPNEVAKFYSSEVILAFEHLHSQDVIYRDLKPENLLLDHDGHIKIADFGFAKRVPERTFTLCGTPEYLAPEIIQQKGHGKGVDWWALGILIFEMLVGYPPFFDEVPVRVYEKILQGKVQFPAWICLSAKHLILSLLNTDHTKRLGSTKNGVSKLKGHEWFEGVDWDMVLQRRIPAPLPAVVKTEGDACYFERYPESPMSPTASCHVTDAQQALFKSFGPMC